MSARTSIATVLAGLAAAILAVLVGLAVATDAAPSAAGVATVSAVGQSGVHPNTADREQKASFREQSDVHPNTANREQKARSVVNDAAASGSHQAVSARILHQTSDWAAYRSAERTTVR